MQRMKTPNVKGKEVKEGITYHLVHATGTQTGADSISESWERAEKERRRKKKSKKKKGKKKEES